MRTVGTRLIADTSDYMRKMKAAGVATKDLAGELGKASKAGKLDKVADQAARFGVLGAAAFVGIVKSAADFDKQMSAVSAATHASTGDMAKLRAAALQAGKDTMYSATQAAQGITELSKAGVSTADVLGGGLKGALSLAAAGQLDVGDAAEIAATAMNQFKLKGAEIPHVADLLAAGAGKAQGSVKDLSMALNQSGLIASQTGLSIEDTTGTLAAFASAGLLGSDAGTSFKTMLQALQAPSSKSADLMKELGISAYDTQGNFVGITKLAGQLKTQLGTLTPELRANALAQIFGSDATRAASVLYEQGAAGIQTWINKTNDAGYAAQTAAKLTDNLAGDIERLKGSLETLAISSGSGANSGIRVLTKGLNGLVNQFLDLPPAVGSTVTVLAGVAGAAGLGLYGFIKLRKGMAEAVTQLTAMGPAGEKAAVGLQKTTKWAGLATAAFIGLEVAGAVADKLGAAAVNVDSLTNSLTNYVNTGKTAGELGKVFGSDLDKLADSAQAADAASHGFWGGLNDLTSNIPGVNSLVDTLNEKIYGLSFNQAKDNLVGLDAALVGFMTTTNDARKSSDLWNQVLLKSHLNTEQLAALLPDAYKKVGELNAAADAGTGSLNGMAGAAKGAATATDAAAAAAKAAKDKLDPYVIAQNAAASAARGHRSALVDLASALDAQLNPVLGLISAEKDFKVKEDAAAAAVKNHGAKSKEVRAASLDLAAAAITLTGKVGALGGSFDGKLSPAMRTALTNAHLTKRQINDVEAAFKTAKTAGDKFAKPYQASVTVRGDSAAMIKLRALNIMQNALRKGVSISTSAARALAGDAAAARDRGVFASGGMIPGYSPHKRADNIPIAATAGEYMHPVDAVEYYGVPAMDAIRRKQVPREVLDGFATGALGKMGDLPFFATGGLVWPYPATAARTRIPSYTEASSVVGGPGAAFVRSQDGKPYIWASAGPNGYDCSGIVSAVYNVLHGRNPYSHTFSTGSLPGRWFPKGGIGGPLTAAWSNPGQYPASSSTGHMMGMVGGLTFESSGSRGVHLGASTRRLTDFAHIAHYDQGGYLPPGWSLAHNGTGRPEQVIPDRYVGGSSGGGGGNTYVNITAPISVNGGSQSADQIAGAVNRKLGALIDVYTRGT